MAQHDKPADLLGAETQSGSDHQPSVADQSSVDALTAQIAERDDALAAAGEQIGKQEGEIVALTAQIAERDDALAAVGERIGKQETEVVALKAQIADLKAGAKAARKRAVAGDGELTVTVLSGVVHHPLADGGKAEVGQSFLVPEAERADLQALADRSVISLAG